MNLKNLILKLTLVSSALFIVFASAVYVLQGQVLYHPTVPSRSIITTPDSIGLAYENVTIKTEDGVTLHGWHIEGRSSRVALFFHGNAGNISHRLQTINQLHSLGLSVLIIDYRGYGKSTGRPSETGLYRDAHAAWQFLIEEKGKQPGDIVIIGRSLGGSVASWLAAQQSPLALIVEASFTSVPNVAEDLYPGLPVKWFIRFRHPTRDHVRQTKSSVLIIHSRGDEIIPYHHGEALFAAANTPKTFLEVRGGHNDFFVHDEETYLAGVKSFLDGLPEDSQTN